MIYKYNLKITGGAAPYDHDAGDLFKRIGFSDISKVGDPSRVMLNGSASDSELVEELEKTYSLRELAFFVFGSFSRYVSGRLKEETEAETKPFNHKGRDLKSATGVDERYVMSKIKKGLPFIGNTRSEFVELLENTLTTRELAVYAEQGIINISDKNKKEEERKKRSFRRY